jgi:hypothetical protein
MSRFFVAIFVGLVITTAVSTSASAFTCTARAPNGATGTGYSIIIGRAQSLAMRRCINRGGGAGCKITYCGP